MINDVLNGVTTMENKQFTDNKNKPYLCKMSTTISIHETITRATNCNYGWGKIDRSESKSSSLWKKK